MTLKPINVGAIVNNDNYMFMTLKPIRVGAIVKYEFVFSH